MTPHRHAMVWIDHQLAKVFRFDDGASDTSVVHSSHPHQHLHHKANSGDSGHAPVDQAFLERVASALAQAGAILITGPAGAKRELYKQLERRHPHLAAKVSAVETLDHPTDGQLLAYARAFFDAEDRTRAPGAR